MKSKEIKSGKGYGYETNLGIKCMIRCFKCGKENYAMAVSSGNCTWCGYSPNKPETKTAGSK